MSRSSRLLRPKRSGRVLLQCVRFFEEASCLLPLLVCPNSTKSVWSEPGKQDFGAEGGRFVPVDSRLVRDAVRCVEFAGGNRAVPYAF